MILSWVFDLKMFVMSSSIKDISVNLFDIPSWMNTLFTLFWQFVMKFFLTLSFIFALFYRALKAQDWELRLKCEMCTGCHFSKQLFWCINRSLQTTIIAINDSTKHCLRKWRPSVYHIASVYRVQVPHLAHSALYYLWGECRCNRLFGTLGGSRLTRSIHYSWKCALAP